MIKGKQCTMSLLDDDNYHHDPMVAFTFMQQLSLKAALKQQGSEAELARIKKASQLHRRGIFVAKNCSTLTEDQQKKVLAESHLFVVRKRDGLTNKARIVAG